MATNLENLISIRDGYLAALLADAANPVPSHTIDGVTINSTQWRESMIKQIAALNDLISAYNPQEIVSVIV